MKYDKDKLFEDAKRIAKEKNCFFIDQLVSFLPITRETFYKYFKRESDRIDIIKDILTENRIKTKTAMYKKWFDSDNPTLQVALMKLIASNEEAHRLNGTRTENKNTNTTEIKVVTQNEQDKKDIEKLLNEIDDN